MTDSDQAIINATMQGYMAGIAERENANPFAYIQAEAWAFQHGYEQGRLHRAQSEVRDQIKPVPREPRHIDFVQPPPVSHHLENFMEWMMRRMQNGER